MRWASRHYKITWVINIRKQHLEDVKHTKREGALRVLAGDSDTPIDYYIKANDPGVQEAKDLLAELKKKLRPRHTLHVWGFAAGLLLLMCSRGLEPALEILDWVKWLVTI